MNTSFKMLLVSYFDIQNIPADCRVSAFRTWESSAKKHLEQKTSVVQFVTK